VRHSPGDAVAWILQTTLRRGHERKSKDRNRQNQGEGIAMFREKIVRCFFKNGWRVAVKIREIKKGKHAGKYEVITSLGKRAIVKNIKEL
jgi:hypothetical protein